MKKDLVMDSDALLGAFIEGDEHHPEVVQLIQDLEGGEALLHISTLVPVEVCAAVVRKLRNKIGDRAAELFAKWVKKNIEDWINAGRLRLYPLDEWRMDKAGAIAIRDKLKGADSVIAEVAEELELALLTFDKEILKRFKGKKP